MLKESSQRDPNAGQGSLAQFCRAIETLIARVAALVVRSTVNERQPDLSGKSGGDWASVMPFGSEASLTVSIGAAADTKSLVRAAKAI